MRLKQLIWSWIEQNEVKLVRVEFQWIKWNWIWNWMQINEIKLNGVKNL